MVYISKVACQLEYYTFLPNEPFVFISTKYQDLGHHVIKLILILGILIKLDNVEIL